MNSIMNAVTTMYGPSGEVQPSFRYPVVLAPRAVAIIGNRRERMNRMIDEAADAVELIGRFGDRSRHVDFATHVAMPADRLPIAMRAVTVATGLGKVVRIDVAPALGA